MLILLRHGESTWNAKNLFTGWVDVPLSDKGRDEARAAGRLLREAKLLPDQVHTSLLTRAINTCELALNEAGLSWLPVSRSVRLNERHYGALQGKNKAQTAAEFGEAQVKLWRRSYDVPPPPLPLEQDEPARDPRYRALAPDSLPRTECLKDVVGRVLPWFYDEAAPALRRGQTLLVVAHGNSLRALIMHLEKISESEIPELNVPTGIPRLYKFNSEFQLSEAPRYLGDAAEAAARALAVQQQASKQ